jgi:hypothetical protein
MRCRGFSLLDAAHAAAGHQLLRLVLSSASSAVHATMACACSHVLPRERTTAIVSDVGSKNAGQTLLPVKELLVSFDQGFRNLGHCRF